MSHENTLYLIDGSAYMYRAYHAVRSLSNSAGLPTNAVFGFTRMIQKLMADRKPAYVAMFFDAKGPTFRHERFDAYKAHRPPMPEEMVVQIPYIKDVTRAFQIPLFEQQGFEADDLIGTLAKLAEEAGFSVVMVTGDKDFVQLVTEKTVIWDPMKEKTRDLPAIREEYGLSPVQIIDVMGLSGDTADNIPGVPGVGPKTALSLIQTYGSMEALYENLDKITQKKLKENLTQYRDQAFLSRELVTILREAPIQFDPEALKVKEPDREKLFSLYQLLEFTQLQQAVAPTEKREKNYRAIQTREDLSALVARLSKAPSFAVDTETTGLDSMRVGLVGISLSMEPDEAFYIPVGHTKEVIPEQLPMALVLDTLRPVFENPKIEKIGQNIKYDWMILSRHGLDLAGKLSRYHARFLSPQPGQTNPRSGSDRPRFSGS